MSQYDENLPMDEETNIITLMDNDGKEVNFEFLDLIEYQGKRYVVLLPEEDAEDDGMVVILEVVDVDEDMEEYRGIDDPGIVDAVFGIFKEKFQDEFDFE